MRIRPIVVALAALIVLACAFTVRAQAPSQTLLIHRDGECGLYGWIRYDYDNARIEATAVSPCSVSLPLAVDADLPYLFNAEARTLLADRRFFADSFGG